MNKPKISGEVFLIIIIILCCIFKYSADVGKEKEFKRGYLEGQNDVFDAAGNYDGKTASKIIMRKRDSLKIEDKTRIIITE